jgi:allantoate deiminase
MDLDRLTDEVLRRCDILGRCSEEPHRLTRTFLRPPMREVHDHLRSWMTAAALQVRIDAVGNMIGRRAAGDVEAKVIAVGSHIDTVPEAGRYDGVLGVLLGVAAAEALTGRAFRRALDVIAFSEEEGVRFHTPYLGSLAVCGRLTPEQLAITDADGVTIADAIRQFGLDREGVPNAAYPSGQVAGYFEVHIEQGPILDSLDRPLGVVTAIVGQSRYWLRFIGKAGHAGAQPMDQRRDALVAAAEFIESVEAVAQLTDGLRATVGSIKVSPGAANVVPGDVRLSLDIRHENNVVRRRRSAELLELASTIATGRKLRLDVKPAMEDQKAVQMDDALTDRLARMAGDTVPRMPSGAGHDAAILASICPAAMLFVRSPGGISHHPDESVRREDVRAALDVIISFLAAELDR